MFLGELGGSPGVDCVNLADGGGLAAGQVDEFAVGVAANQHGPIAQIAQPVQDLHRLRPGGVVAGHDDQVGADHVRLGEHGIQHRQHAVDVGQNRHAADHAATVDASRPPITAAPQHELAPVPLTDAHPGSQSTICDGRRATTNPLRSCLGMGGQPPNRPFQTRSGS